MLYVTELKELDAVTVRNIMRDSLEQFING
jgi:hypothetical protein